MLRVLVRMVLSDWRRMIVNLEAPSSSIIDVLQHVTHGAVVLGAPRRPKRTGARQSHRGVAIASGTRMTFCRIVLTCCLGLAVTARPALAQRHVPDAGMLAVGASVGATMPRDASLQNGLEVVGQIDAYLTPRVSIRGQVGATWWDITGRGFTGTIKPLYFDGNLVYNWEGGVWHPYVTAGVGAYRFHSDINPALSGSDTKVGVNLGGGIEYFFTRRATITGEVLFHKVDGFASPVATFPDGSFWSFTLGAKKYF